MTLQFGPDLTFYHDLVLGIEPRPLITQLSPPIVGRILKSLTLF